MWNCRKNKREIKEQEIYKTENNKQNVNSKFWSINNYFECKVGCDMAGYVKQVNYYYYSHNYAPLL